MSESQTPMTEDEEIEALLREEALAQAAAPTELAPVNPPSVQEPTEEEVVTAEPTPAVEPTRVRDELIEGMGLQGVFLDHVYNTIEEAKRSGSTQLAVGLYSVMEYARDMSVLGVSPREGVRQHVRLYQAIRTIAGKSTDAEFVGAWSAMLAIVNANRSTRQAFHELMVHRWIDQVALGDGDLKNWQRLINVILSTCDPERREGNLRQVDIAKSLAAEKDDLIRHRLQAYYQR